MILAWWLIRIIPMERLTRLVRSQITSWQNSLESVLEKNPSLVPKTSKIASSFEVSTNLHELQDTLAFLPHQAPNYLVTVFSRLSPYFESGILLGKTSFDQKTKIESWSAGVVFYQGKYHPLPKDNQQLNLPYLCELELRKTTPYAVLQPLQLTEICDGSDEAAFVFKASPDLIYLLFSKLPEPWLRHHVEATHALLKAAIINNE